MRYIAALIAVVTLSSAAQAESIIYTQRNGKQEPLAVMGDGSTICGPYTLYNPDGTINMQVAKGSCQPTQKVAKD